VGIALGASGLESVLDLRGQEDLYGRPLMVSIVGMGDELAAAASILQGQGDEGLPVVLVRGLERSTEQGNGATLVRDEAEDLFR
jgi:coenzyme F420-0:L-glutamate ligase/coenzyme F420-1:gamma-L-glutamate ligase